MLIELTGTDTISWGSIHRTYLDGYLPTYLAAT